MSRWGLKVVGFIVGLLLLPLPVYGQAFQIQIMTSNEEVIIGELRGEIKIALTSGGEWRVPAAEIVSIERDFFRLRNGMRVKGRINQEKLEVQTSYGPASVRVAEIRQMCPAQPEGRPCPSPK